MQRSESNALGVFGALVGLFALLVAGIAVVVSNNNGGAREVAGAGSGAAASVAVTGTEFAFDPGSLTVAQGGSIEFRNAGTTKHNLTVGSLATPDINGGESATLSLAGLAPGQYEMFCSIAGHKEGGMVGTLTVAAGGAGGSTGGATSGGGMGGMTAGGDSMALTGDYENMPMEQKRARAEQMDAVMDARAALFPAKTMGDNSAKVMEPTVLADGTKVYDLVTKVVDWEVEPGKFVKAWTYNGVVPAPTIKLNVGDKVRINQKNELPESTALHIHGYVGPNAVDGVPPITQKEIKPGDSFTYEFVVDKPIVAMYHSHHNAQTQVPNGMAGAFLVGEVPRPAGIPEPVWKEVMFLNDAGTIGLALNGKSFPATTPYVAKLGDWIQMTYFNEGLQFHPMHLHGPEQLVVQVDNQMLTAPYWTDTVIVAPGQRMTVLVKADNPGVWAWHCHILNHAEGPQGMFGMVTALIIEDPNATT